MSQGSLVQRCRADVEIHTTADYATAGGIAALLLDGTVEQCSSAGTIQGKSWSGGLLGNIFSGNIARCTSVAHVTGRSAGGMAGLIDRGTCSTSYAHGRVQGEVAAGFAAETVSSVLNDCYARGQTRGVHCAAGFIARLNNRLNDKADNAQINRCYAAVRLKLTSDNGIAGGLIGENGGAEVITSYWDKEYSGTLISAGGAGRTTTEMTHPHAANTYINWDLNGIWAADENGNMNAGYPWLRNLPRPPQDDENDIEGEEPDVEGEEPGIEGEEPGIEGEEPDVEGEEPGIEGEEPGIEGEEPGIEGEEPGIEGEEPGIEGEGPDVEGEGPDVEGEEPGIEGEEPEVEGEVSINPEKKGCAGCGCASKDLRTSVKDLLGDWLLVALCLSVLFMSTLLRRKV